mmetsp:Transcript_13859/g.21277  ORF Transcript_13859/g.21277 Transcript_13859/m.21277 type:complete len:200 (+) Transcript_13859:1305-1904(+)
MAMAVSLASPVIIMTRIPASEHFRMLSATSGRAGSFIPTKPTRVRPLSISTYLLGSCNKGCLLDAVSISDVVSMLVTVPSYCFNVRSRFVVSFTARPSIRRGRPASSDVFASISLRSDPVSLTTFPLRSLTCVHRLISKFGAPFTNNRLPLRGLSFDLHRTPILFRSLLNSNVNVRRQSFLQVALCDIAISEGGRLALK